MALSAFSVDKAYEILLKVVPEMQHGLLGDEAHIIRTGWIRAISQKEDGGCESVFADVQDITPEQLQTFDELSKRLSNTVLQEDMGNGITRIGWF